jgi:peptidoglycan L-alanyl-D-glutamate endopeptidase CwlK
MEGYGSDAYGAGPYGKWELSHASMMRLFGVHPLLVKVVHDAVGSCPIQFAVTEGCRSIARERQLMAQGFSALKDPYHCRHVPTGQPATGKAVDLAPLDEHKLPTWQYIPPFLIIAEHMKAAAAKLHVPIDWGGDWHTFKDYPHFQLPYAEYP